MPPKNVLTTGQVARICNVAPRTVAKWFDRGDLKGYRIPGSKDRRIPLENLITFMKAHNMPLDAVALPDDAPDRPTTHVVLLSSDEHLTAALSAALSAATSDRRAFKLHPAASAFQAGVIVKRTAPDLFILDLDQPDIDARQLSRDLQSQNLPRSIDLCALTAHRDDARTQTLLKQGFSQVLDKSTELEKLASWIVRSVPTGNRTDNPPNRPSNPPGNPPASG